MRIALMGFGNVGRDFAKLLLEYDHDICVSAIMTSKGGVMGRDCIGRSDLAKYVVDGIPTASRVGIDDILNIKVEAAVVSIPPNYANGEPNLGIYRKLLSNGVNVITSDKTGLALDFAGLMRTAQDGGAKIEYRATVMAGTPAIDLIRGLRYRRINSIKAVLNATTNFVLTEMENGSTREEAVRAAIKEKLAEPNPSIDLDGWDAGAKLVILVNQLGLETSLSDVRLTKFEVDESLIKSAQARGMRVKQVASADLDSKDLWVAPMQVDKDSLLASVSGNYNAVEVNVGRDVIGLRGPAGPSRTTAEVMLADLLRIAKEEIP